MKLTELQQDHTVKTEKEKKKHKTAKYPRQTFFFNSWFPKPACLLVIGRQ